MNLEDKKRKLDEFERRMIQEMGEKEWNRFKMQDGQDCWQMAVEEEMKEEAEWNELLDLLQPRIEGQNLTSDLWARSTPPKLELYGGKAVWGGRHRDRLLLALTFNVGLGHFLTLLSDESKEELKKLLL